MAQMVKSLPAVWETWVRSLGGEDLEKEMATPLQYSCLENPRDGGAWQAQSMGSQRVGHDWVTLHSKKIRPLSVNSLAALTTSNLLYKQ